jgi:putative two-component system response regulator
LVSTYCALTENRSFRKAFTREEALAFMEPVAGVDFNADIFNIYKRIARQLH